MAVLADPGGSPVYYPATRQDLEDVPPRLATIWMVISIAVAQAASLLAEVSFGLQRGMRTAQPQDS